MFSTSLFRWFCSPVRRTDRRVRWPQPSHCRLALEALEIRALPSISPIPLPPAPAGYPMVSSASARLDGLGDVFGTATYSNGSFPPQFKSEAFQWTAAGGTQLLIDPANQPYSTVVDVATDGSLLVRSNNPDPYTSYFDLLAPGGGGGGPGGTGGTGAPEFLGLGGNLENLFFSAKVLPTGVSASATTRPPTARPEIGLPAAQTVTPVASGLAWHGRVLERLFTEFGEDLDTRFLPDSLLLR